MGSLFDTKRYLFKLRAHLPWRLALGCCFRAGNGAGTLLPKKVQRRRLRSRSKCPCRSGGGTNCSTHKPVARDQEPMLSPNF
jgi:hypothetical protein